MSVSKVGLGWDVGERNYTTLADWIAAKKATGVFEDAWCKGNLGGSFSTITGTDFSAGALIYGDVVYNGANHADLAFLPRRLAIASSGAQVIAQDLYVKHTDGGQYSVTASNGHLVQRLYVEHNSTTGVNAAILFLQANGLAKNCVVKTTNPGNQYTIRTGGSGSAIENCITIGGLNAAYSVVTSSTIKNTFAVGQAETTACQNYPNGLPPANINNASTDATGGVVSLHNVDPYSVFADYDNGDYRIKLSSELGVNGVGAFFYDDGGGAIDAVVSYDMGEFGFAIVADNTVPSFNSNVSYDMGEFGFAIVADNTVPSFNSNVSYDMGEFGFAIVADNTVPTGGAVVSYDMGEFGFAIVADNTVPSFNSNVSYDMGEFGFAIVADNTVPAGGAVVSYDMGEFGFAIVADNTVPPVLSAVSYDMGAFGFLVVARQPSGELSQPSSSLTFIEKSSTLTFIEKSRSLQF